MTLSKQGTGPERAEPGPPEPSPELFRGVPPVSKVGEPCFKRKYKAMPCWAYFVHFKVGEDYCCTPRSLHFLGLKFYQFIARPTRGVCVPEQFVRSWLPVSVLVQLGPINENFWSAPSLEPCLHLSLPPRRALSRLSSHHRI